MLIEHMNYNFKDWFEIMWINGDHCKLLGRKIYYSNPYYDVFCRLYFKDRVAVRPRGWIGVTGKTFFHK